MLISLADCDQLSEIYLGEKNLTTPKCILGPMSDLGIQ